MLNKVRDITEHWIKTYTNKRLHDGLHDLTPWAYLEQHKQLESSNL
jgi:hypothetical protein